jgi:P-type E1-E2 ATPase
VEDFKAIAGYGLEGRVEFEGQQRVAYIGRPTYIAEKLPEELKEKLLARIEEIEKAGELLAVLVVDNHPFIFHFQDTLRPHIVETVAAIKDRGWQTIMLTGDHLQSARKIAQAVGVDQFYADLTPEDKLTHVSQIAQQTKLAMIGDGINDAPALARANVGICMGKVGSTAAIDAADIVLLRDDIHMLDWLIGKAIQTQRIVKQNLALAILAIFIASLPALAGIVPLWLAVIMHEGGTVLVGLNALRLLK